MALLGAVLGAAAAVGFAGCVLDVSGSAASNNGAAATGHGGSATGGVGGFFAGGWGGSGGAGATNTGGTNTGGSQTGGSAGTATGGSAGTGGSGGTSTGGSGGSGGTDPCPSGEEQVVEAEPFEKDIPNDDYDGTLGSMRCVDLIVEDNGCHSTQDVTVELGITHSWVGDLVIKVQSPNDTITTLMSRPGCGEAADDGDDYGGSYPALCPGDESNLLGVHSVLFYDGAPNDAEDMGSDLIGGVVCRDDDKCEWDPNPGAGPGNGLADFHGLEAVGTWHVCVGDALPGDNGSLWFVELTVKAGP